MDRKILVLKIYTIFLVVIFLGVIIPDFFSPNCFSSIAEIIRMIIISIIGISVFVIFYIFPKRWELLSLIHIVFAVWLTVQTAFPSKYMISALLYTEAIIISFVHGFFSTKTKRKFTAITAGLFIMPLFEPGFTLKILLRAELLNAYIFGLALISFFLIRHYFIEYIVKERHILFSKKDVLYLESLNLCQREIDFINFLIKGITYKEIAESYKMSESSVKKHMSMLFAKFGCNSRENFLSYISQFDVSFSPKEEENN